MFWLANFLAAWLLFAIKRYQIKVSLLLLTRITRREKKRGMLVFALLRKRQKKYYFFSVLYYQYELVPPWADIFTNCDISKYINNCMPSHFVIH